MPTTPSWISDGSPIDDPLGYGERAVQWLRRLRHPKNPAPGHAFKLDPWQERIIRRLYGPRHADGTRKVRRLVLLLPRGNRKTSLAAAITLLHLVGPERMPGGLIMSAASALEQSRELYNEAALIIQHDRRLAAHLRVKTGASTIQCARASTTYKAISADGGVQHGKTPAVVIADELHVWKGRQGRDLWEALDSSLVKTPGTLMVIASTSGRGQENLAWEQIDYALKVQRGEIVDEATLPVIFMAEKDDDWREEALWHQVNPGLAHGYPDIAGLRDKARKAEHSPGDRDGFQQFNLNVWLDKSTSSFVDMTVYDEGKAPVDLEALKGRPCWLGVDMSTTTDLTAVVAAFPDEDGGFTVVPHVFCPADNIRGRADRDGVPYPAWERAGRLTATPGNVVDYQAVVDHIRHLVGTFDVREIAFDRALAQPVMAPLVEERLPVIEMDLSVKNQAAGLNTLERAIVGRQFRHGGHPALRWCMENVAVYVGFSGLRTMHKGKSTDRIDAAFACWMAVQRASLGESNRSIYDDEKKRPSGPMIWGM
ncbi:terminase large subunit [Methylobacterium ajmalii]|uniref:Terminase large subunit n=1 Tax=Methylobacterium ajmalii TaxID=2738439 RepID=A0ABV0A7L8_9HYPH